MARTNIWQGSLRTPSKPLDGICITSLSSGESVALPSPPPTSSSSTYLDAQTSLITSRSSIQFKHHAHPSSAETSSPPVQRTQIRKIKLNLTAGRPAAPKVAAIKSWIDRLKNEASEGEFVVREGPDSVVKLADLDSGVLIHSVEEDLRSGYKIRATHSTQPSGLLYFHAALIPEPKAASLSLDTQGRTLHGLLIDFVPFDPDHDVPHLTLLIYGIKSTPLALNSETERKKSKKPSLSIFAVPFPVSTTPLSPPPSAASIESAISSSAPSTPCLLSASYSQMSAPGSTPSCRLRPRGTFSPRHPRLSNVAIASSILSSSREPSPIPIVSPAQLPRPSKTEAESTDVPVVATSKTVSQPTPSTSVPSSTTSPTQSCYTSSLDGQKTVNIAKNTSFPTSKFTFTAPSAIPAKVSSDRSVAPSTTIKRIVLKKSSLYLTSKPNIETAQAQGDIEQKNILPSSDSSESSSSSPSSDSDSDADEEKKGGSQEENTSARKSREERDLKAERVEEKGRRERLVGNNQGKSTDWIHQNTQSVQSDLSPLKYSSKSPSTVAPPLPRRSSNSKTQVELSRHILPLRKPTSITTNTRPAYVNTRPNIRTQLKTQSTRPPPPPDVGFSHPFSSDGEVGEGPIKPIKSELFKDKVSRGDVLIEQDSEDVITSPARGIEGMRVMKRKRMMHEKPIKERSKRLRRVREGEENQDGKSLTSDETTSRRRQASRETLQAGYAALNKLLLRKLVDEALQAAAFPRTHPEFHTIWAWIVRGCAFSLRETFSTQELEETDLMEPIQIHVQSYLPSSFRCSRSSSPLYTDVASPLPCDSSMLSQIESERLMENKAEDERWMQEGGLMALAEIWVAAGETREQKDRPVVSALAVGRKGERGDDSSDLSDEDSSSDSSSVLSPWSSCPALCSTSSSNSDPAANPASSSLPDSESTSRDSTLRKRYPTFNPIRTHIPTLLTPHRAVVSSRTRLSKPTSHVDPASTLDPRPDSNTAIHRELKNSHANPASDIDRRTPQQAVIDVVDEEETEDETWF
ncbi:hypothetical protein [Phaffia rhodozyma]|uniref:Uncharacterized protein n=1 Tax=Phaffia rhodozyma TaxID=264483 RepID=A0A0F7SQ53_PHARH|nr:hypothetical protein [Phaffia rhodozyma]